MLIACHLKHQWPVDVQPLFKRRPSIMVYDYRYRLLRNSVKSRNFRNHISWTNRYLSDYQILKFMTFRSVIKQIRFS